MPLASFDGNYRNSRIKPMAAFADLIFLIGFSPHYISQYSLYEI